MYVCICKAVTDSQIKEAIDKGLSTRRELFQCYGLGGECGKCNKQIKEILDCSNRHGSIMQQVSEQPLLTAC